MVADRLYLGLCELQNRSSCNETEFKALFRLGISTLLNTTVENIFVNVTCVSQMRRKTVGEALCDACLSAHGHDLGLGRIHRRGQCKLGAALSSVIKSHMAERDRETLERQKQHQMATEATTIPKETVYKREAGVGIS